MGVNSSTKRALLMVCAGALLGAVGGCGDRVAGPAATYTGPLYSDGELGAAGEVVQCSTPVRGGIAGHTPYAEGASAQTLDGAWDTARSEAAFDGATTTSGYEIAAEDEARVLYVFEVGDEPKQAVVMRNGPATEGAGGPGWYVESWGAGGAVATHHQAAPLPLSAPTRLNGRRARAFRRARGTRRRRRGASRSPLPAGR